MKSTTTAPGRAGPGESTTNCSPEQVSLEDAAPLFAIALLLLFGELSEFSIPGVLSLKRQVERQQETQRELEQRVSQLQLSIGMSNSLTLQVGPEGYQSPGLIEQAVRRKTEGAQAADHAVPVPDTMETRALKFELIEEYKKIEGYIRVARVGGRSNYSDRTRAANEALLPWFRRFREEIESVVAVRNSLVHTDGLVSVEDLRSTLNTIRLLREALPDQALEAMIDIDPWRLY